MQRPTTPPSTAPATPPITAPLPALPRLLPMRPPSAAPLAPPITAPICVRLMEPSLAQTSSIALNTVNKAAMRSPGIFIIFMLRSYLWREIVAAAITQKGPAGVNRRGTSRQARYCGRGRWDRIAVLSVASAASSLAFFAAAPKGLESLLLAELAALGAAELRETRAGVAC